ncbi:hypothetical protein [Halobacillus litoralis]|uniref:hypothetical protein n=1 Tax=Halobacillus litoralis TaxID=45668 RepID=UPI001CFD63A9|nr:hypothetical protein [Halobacillus litoralis]
MKKIKAVNWTCFILFITAALGSMTSTFKTLPQDTVEAESRFHFSWGAVHTLTSILLLVALSIIITRWKKFFPFNIPLVIIVCGFIYAGIFLTFTTGWVGIQGLIGLMIGLFTGGLMILGYSFFLYIREGKKEVR